MTVVTEVMPIADYDDLRIIDILPRLASLSAHELATIERYELAHKYRTTLLDRVDTLLRQMHRDDLIVEESDLVEADEVDEASVEEIVRVDAPVSAEVIDLASYDAHDPRLWRTLLVPVPQDEPDIVRTVESSAGSKRRWFRRSA